MRRCQKCNKITDDETTVCPDDQTLLVEDTLATSLQQALGAKYTLTRLIGKGAMGAVYRARHRDLDDVAIKVMLGPTDNAQLSERFLREARALRRLRHQHAVTIYDLDRSIPGITYMVMEMVEGGSLRHDLRTRGRLTLEQTMEVAEAVSGALQAAHDRGIIHRDLKPDNILVSEEMTVSGRILRTIKIADFGIVKLRGGQREGDTAMKLTQIGTPIGTPFYMSPEQWFGEGGGANALDGRTDIYALGCTLYELLTGRTPFVGKTSSELRRQHLEHEPPPLSQLAPHVPETVSRVIMRALEKDRDDRYQTAAEFFTELRRAYNDSHLAAVTATPEEEEEDRTPTEIKQVDKVLPARVKVEQPPPPRDSEDSILAADTQHVEAERRAEQQVRLAAAEEARLAAAEARLAAETEARLAAEAEARLAAETAVRQAQAAQPAEEPQEEEPEAEAEVAVAVPPDEPLEGSIIGYEAEMTQVHDNPSQTQPDFTDAEMTMLPGSASKSDVNWTNQVGTELTVAEVPAHRKPKWIWIALICVLLVGAGVLVSLGIYVYRHYLGGGQGGASLPANSILPKQSSPVANAPRGTLRIFAPSGSEVFIDDEKVGAVGEGGDLAAQAVAGLRNVRVIAAGYRPWIKNTSVPADSTTEIKTDLKRPLEAAKDATAEVRQKRIEEFNRAKNYYAAEVEYRELLKVRPNDASVHLYLADALNEQKRFNEAIAEYEAATRLDPKDADTLFSLGSLYAIKGRDPEAEATLRKAVQLTPKDADAHNSLAWILQRHPDKLGEAMDEVEQALKLKRQPDYLDTKAYILLARNSLEEALTTEQRALTLVDKNSSAMYKAGIAVIIYRMGRTDEAISTYKQIRQANPNAEWGDIKRLEMLRGYSHPVLETFATLIAQTN